METLKLDGKMKTILTGDEAIEAYEEIVNALNAESVPKKCGYFTSDDCKTTSFYDPGTIVAFDATQVNGTEPKSDWYGHEEVFSNEDDAIDWINR